MEDWADEAALIYKANAMDPALFKLMFRDIADPASRRIMNKVRCPATIDELIDILARELFPHSEYAGDLLVEMVTARPQPTAG